MAKGLWWLRISFSYEYWVSICFPSIHAKTPCHEYPWIKLHDNLYWFHAVPCNLPFPDLYQVTVEGTKSGLFSPNAMATGPQWRVEWKEHAYTYIAKGIRDKHKHAQYRIHKQSHALDLSGGFERAYFENDALPRETWHIIFLTDQELKLLVDLWDALVGSHQLLMSTVSTRVKLTQGTTQRFPLHALAHLWDHRLWTGCGAVIC